MLAATDTPIFLAWSETGKTALSSEHRTSRFRIVILSICSKLAQSPVGRSPTRL